MGATNSTQQSTTLTTSRGSLLGINQTDKTTNKPICSRYTRIPYALPPTGSRRWRRPVALPANFSFNDAKTGEPGDYTRFGNICPQPEYGHSSAALENENAAEEQEKVPSEDCLYLNIWVPAGEAPEGGWPVQIYLHGGWLQVGDAMQSSSHDPFDLLKTYPRIIISPTYRLNLFGFLASPELSSEENSTSSGNYGFWDQRMAIEWVHSNVSLFGGNPSNISVGGLSAGAHSTIFQLHYDTYLPPSERLIKRIFLFSNAIGIQPKATSSPECQEQFNELLSSFNIPFFLSPSEKMAALRAIPAKELISEIPSLKHHTFRATTDDTFISASFLKSIHDGSFTSLLASHGVKVFLGEVANEDLLYRMVNPATSLSSLETLLNNYYPTSATSALLKSYDLPSPTSSAEEWAAVGATILADCQVHAMIRGFAHSLLNPPKGKKGLTIESVLRYRIEWRAKGLDEWLDPKVKCCHASDIPIWWLSGKRAGFDENDEKVVGKLVGAFDNFLRGEDVQWGTRGEEDVKVVRADGEVAVVKDQGWEEGLRIWDVLARSQGV